tara:strand:+ start:33 stop:1562 length:1530 start_codon:yes stop_codon:yes gene_type:complete
MAEKSKLPILHYLADRKSSNVSENILKTEEERFELEQQLGQKQNEFLDNSNDKLKKDKASKPSKIGDWIRKISDAQFLVPSAIQDFLRKGEDEGKDVASRIDNLTSGFFGLFKNKDAKEAARQGLTLKEFREQTKIAGNQNDSLDTKLMQESINTEILEQLDDKAKNALFGDEKFHNDVIEILKKQDVSSTTIQKDILNQITELAKHATTGNSLRVHDANVTDRLDEANKHYEDQMEFSKDKRREAKLQAQKDGESQKELLNATKAGGAGMVAAGGAGAGEGGGLLSGDNILKAAGAVQAFRGLRGLKGIGGLFKGGVGLGVAGKGGMLTSGLGVGAKGGTALAAKGLLAGGGNALLMGALTTALPIALAGTAGVLLFKGVKGLIQQRKEFKAMSPEEQEKELARRRKQMEKYGFIGKKEDDEKIKKDQADKKSLGFVPVNLDKKTKTLEKVAEESEDLKRKKEKGDGTNIVPISNNTNQVNNFDNNTIISTPIVDPTRILFRAAGVSG